MGNLVSKTLKPFRVLRIRFYRTPTTDVKADGDSRQDAPQDTTNGTTSEPSARARDKLDRLSCFRISSSAVTFTSVNPDGSGGKAEVARGTLNQGKGASQRQVAVKKIRYHGGKNKQEFTNEFVHEVEILAGLSHENIVRFLGFLEDLENGKAWIVLCWAPNGNVSEFLATGKWEIPERLSLIKDAFRGLEYLHTRRPPICHGDLKSFNILISSSYHAIITDFGSARALSDSELAVRDIVEEQGSAEGDPTAVEAYPQIHLVATGNQLTLTGPAYSLRWAPPEVVNGERPSLPSDIWTAGWVCWEIMTDKVPFPELNSAGPITLMVVQGKVPPACQDAQLSQIIRLCSLMKDCWRFDLGCRPSITQCLKEIDRMPSIPPLGGIAPDSKVRSTKLLLQMGWIQYSQNRYENAASLYQHALRAATDEDNQIASAEALYWLGKVYNAQCKYTDAEESYIRAQDIFARIGNDEGRAKTLRGLGQVYCTQSKHAQAQEFFMQAKEILTRTGTDMGRGNTMRGLAEVYHARGRYTEAEGSFIQAQKILTRIDDDLGQANATQGLGEVYLSQYKYTEAEESFIRARDIYTRIGHGLGRANTLRGLGDAYVAQEKYTEAEASFTQAQDIYTQIGRDLGRAKTLQGLGEVHRACRKYTEAENSFNEAQDIYARIGHELGRANTLREMGEVHVAQCEYAEAKEYFLPAQEIYSRSGHDHGQANTLRDFGYLSWKQVSAMRYFQHLIPQLPDSREDDEVRQTMPNGVSAV